MGEQGIFRVRGNDHRVAPDVRALLRHIEAHVLVLVENDGGVAGVDDLFGVFLGHVGLGAAV